MKKRKDWTAKDRNARGVRARKVGLIEYETYVPNIRSFKTLQIRITGWIKVCDNVDQYEFDKSMSRLKYRIKNCISMWSRQHPMYKDIGIIDIHTTEIDKGLTRKTHQFIKIDIVLYVKEGLKYERDYVADVSLNFTAEINKELKRFDEFNFIENPTYMKRKKKNVQSSGV